MYDIFISYRKRYYPWVKCLYINLVACGFRVFLDEEKIRAGHILSDTLKKAISNSKHFIFIATSDCKDSDWVKFENEYFLGLKKYNSLLSYHPILFSLDTEKLFLEFPILKDAIYRSCLLPSKEHYEKLFSEVLKDISSQSESRHSLVNDFCWLHIPEECSHPKYQVQVTPSVDVWLDDKAKLGEYQKLFFEEDVNFLDYDFADDCYYELSELSLRDNDGVAKLALVLLCYLHHEFDDFRRKKKSEGNLLRERVSQINITAREKKLITCLSHLYKGKEFCQLLK